MLVYVDISPLAEPHKTQRSVAAGAATAAQNTVMKKFGVLTGCWNTVSNQRTASCLINELENAPRYTFSTKEYLPAAGLYLYQYRTYHPIVGRWTQHDPIDYQDSINLYQFCGNNPVNATDPDGQWVQTAVGAAIGAAWGVAAVAVHDVITGERSGWQAYAGAAAGGAVAGALVANFVPADVAGAAGAAAGNFVEQVSNIASGKQDSFSVKSLALDTAVGGFIGAAVGGPKVPGVNQGKGSMLQVAKSMETKLANGTISRVSSRTAINSAKALCVNRGVAEGSIVFGAYLGVKDNTIGERLK